MVAQGLEPGHRLLDVGCGALRGGRRFVDHLDAGGYYGIDINESLLDAGYDIELTDAQRATLPRDHLRATDRFACAFGVPFDFAIANSLFTHISLNPLDEPHAGRHWTERNGFFYYRADLRYAASYGPWRASASSGSGGTRAISRWSSSGGSSGPAGGGW